MIGNYKKPTIIAMIEEDRSFNGHVKSFGRCYSDNFIHLQYDVIKHLTPQRTCIKEKVDGNFMVVKSDSQKIFFLSMVAQDIYLSVCDNNTIATIVYKLSQIYCNVPTETIKNDVVRTINDMKLKQLLTYD
jgi:hypothetical protein